MRQAEYLAVEPTVTVADGITDISNLHLPGKNFKDIMQGTGE
jgi:hypothetical protein